MVQSEQQVIFKLKTGRVRETHADMEETEGK